MLLLCPVRNCGMPLVREPRAVRCARGHSFDRSRTGYLNLLQPQERRSLTPGDSAEAVRARRRLHDLRVSEPLLVGIAGQLAAQAGEAVLDAGCGEGFYLGSLAERQGISGCGIDISTAAVDAAARRYPACEWVVANADRQIPYADSSFDAVVSITGRRNPGEFRRVLQPGGRVLVAVPAPDDLAELRGPKGRDRVSSTAAEFSELFELVATQRAAADAEIDARAVADILQSIYRPRHVERPEPMRVTFSLDLLLFRPRRA